MTPVERAAEALPPFPGPSDIAVARAAFESIDVDRLARVIALHRIECTGPGEVTCRACRERGWMSWPEFHKHVAQAARNYLTGDESDE